MACHKEPPFTAEQVAWIDQRIAEARGSRATPQIVASSLAHPVRLVDEQIFVGAHEAVLDTGDKLTLPEAGPLPAVQYLYWDRSAAAYLGLDRHECGPDLVLIRSFASSQARELRR